MERGNKVFDVLPKSVQDRAKENPHLVQVPLGKLGLKEEAAGKVRVFAMVDPLTQ
jgi:hypothetical protein